MRWAWVPFLLVGAIVLPWTRGGWVLALDWIGGPGVSLPRNFWGLDGAVNGSLGFTLVATALMRTIGPATSWLLIASSLVVAFFAVAWLVQGPSERRLPAGTLFVVNPFVYDRVVAGQIAFVAGYALLPFVVRLLLELSRRWQVRRAAAAGLTMTAAVSLAPHLGWIFVLLAMVLLPRAPRRALHLAVPLAIVAAASSYLLFGYRQGSAVAIASSENFIFQTRGASFGGPYASLLFLRGFWRAQPAPTVPGWPFFFAAIALVVALGAAQIRKQDRPLFWALVPAAVVALLLAAGDQGPAGGAFSWLFEVVPGFGLMREPQKFLALTALAYAAAFGFGVERLTRSGGSRTVVAAGMTLPLLYSPLLFWGLAGQVRPAQYPDDWSQAAQIMGEGEGQLLFLPWHQYLSFPFTSGVIANPADAYFTRRVISGDNVELQRAPTLSTSPRSRYLQVLFAHGPKLCSAGNLFAPLGVEFIALAKTVDWKNYDWLQEQRDLRLIHDGPSIRLYRNMAFTGTVWAAQAVEDVADVGDLIDRSRTDAVAGRAFRARSSGGAPSQAVSPCRAAPAGTPPAGERRSPVEYILDRPTGAPWTVLAEPFDEGWAAAGDTVELATGTTAVRTPNQESIVFRSWALVRVSYGISIAAILVMIGVVAAVPGQSGASWLDRSRRFARTARAIRRDEA